MALVFSRACLDMRSSGVFIEVLRQGIFTDDAQPGNYETRLRLHRDLS